MRRVAWLLALALLAAAAAAQQVGGGGGGGAGGAGMLPSGLNASAGALSSIVTRATGCNDVTKFVSGTGTCIVAAGVTGSGTINTLPRWATSTSLTSSSFSDPGSTGVTASLTTSAGSDEGVPGLEIVGTSIAVRRTVAGPVFLELDGTADVGGIPQVEFDKANGVPSARTAVTSGTVLGAIYAYGYDGTSYNGDGHIYFSAAENFSAGHAATSYEVATTDIATQTSLERITVEGDGNTNIKNGNLVLNGSTSGSVTLLVPAVAGSNTISIPAATGTLALLGSPAFTGTPTAPTAAPGTNTTQLATMAALQAGLSSGSGAIDHVSYQPGLLTAVNPTKAAFHKFSKATTVDNIEGSAATFSCVANPTVTVFECGTSATCASSPVTIGTVTITAAGTVVDGSISSAAITAGDYVAFAMTAGTCASVDLAVTVQTHVN